MSSVPSTGERKGNGGSFTRAFVPGLIVGLVIGAFAGAFITPLLDGGLKSPMLNSGPTPKNGRGATKERSTEPNGDADAGAEKPVTGETPAGDAPKGDSTPKSPANPTGG